MELEEVKLIQESTAIIKQNESLIGLGLWNIGKELKYIRDNKSYKQLGNSTFEEFCEESLKYGRRHAYKFIEIADSYTVPSMAQIQSFGMTKLLSLAKLDEPERNDFIAKNDVQAMTTRELEAKIKAELEAKHKAEVDNLKKCLELEEQRSETLSQSYDRLETVNKEHYKKLRDKERELEIAKENYETGATNNRSRINTLSKEIEELKSQEPKVVEKIVEVIPESTQERIRTLQQAKRDNEVELENLKREITKLSALKDKEETINDTYEKIKIVQEKNRNLMSDSRDIEAFLNWRKKTIDFFAQNTFPITTLNLNQATMKNLKEDIKPMLEIMEGFIYATKQKFKIEEE